MITRINVILMRLVAVLLTLVLISTAIVSGRFARYVTSDANAGSARVAAYVFRVEDNEQHFLDISTITKPGDNISYQFTVTNKSGSVVSEVNESYYVNLELWGSLPLKVTITGGGETLSLEAGEAPVSAATAAQVYQAAVEQYQKYTLTVEWPEKENNISYSWAGLSQLVLSIHAQQVD